MHPSAPLLPVSVPNAPGLLSRSKHALAAVLRLPGRVMLGGFAFLGGAALGRQKGLSPKSSVFAAVSAFGVSQVVVSILNHVRRRRQRKLEEEHEVASQISNLMAWNEALGALRKIVDTFSDGLAAPFTLKHLLLDAELLRRHHTFLYQECVLRERERSRSRELCDGRHFAKFAMASYGFTLLKLLGLMDGTHDLFRDGARAVDVVMHQLDLEPSDILIANLEGDELGLPRHFVAKDAATKSIAIVVRGTNSLSDVLVDLLCDSAPFSKGYAHSGMKDAAEALFTATLPTLRTALAENKGYKIVTCGHSMGAGVAVLLTKVLLDFGFDGVKCYAISPPPVFGPMHCVDERWSSALECFVHCDDIVPRLSLESARALVMEIERIDGLPLSDSELRGLGPTSLRAAISGGEPRDLSGSHGKLVAPLFIPTSRVHWMLRSSDFSHDLECKNGDSKFVSVRAESSVFSRMLITRSCVTSHFPNKYIDAFNNLGLPAVPRPPRNQGSKPSADIPLYYDGELGW